MEDKTEITIKSYDRNAKKFEAKFMDLKLYKQSIDAFKSHITSGDNVLDLGCGPGNVSKYLFDCDNTLKIFGIDLSVEMINLARINAPEIEFYVGDIRNLKEFAYKKYEAIIAAFCLPFLYDTEASSFISNISKMLKRNGTLYLSTMMGSGHRFEVPGFSDGDMFFFNYYSKEFLNIEFEKNDLMIEEYIEQDYMTKSDSILKDMIFILKKR